jgi:hypothetical protein
MAYFWFSVTKGGELMASEYRAPQTKRETLFLFSLSSVTAEHITAEGLRLDWVDQPETILCDAIRP